MSTPLEQKQLTRGQLAKLAGCGVELIRFYEGKGILPTPKRAANGYRVYDAESYKRLVLVLNLRAMGFSLKELRSWADLLDGEYSCGEGHSLADEHLKLVTEKLKLLRAIQRRLAKLVESCGDGELPDCPIIDALLPQSMA